MVGKTKLIFEMPEEEKKWFEELVRASGEKYNIGLFRELVDKKAKEINFCPRPK